MGRKRKQAHTEPRGGWKQIAAARVAAEAGAGMVSTLAIYLIQQWAWGFKSAAEVQKEACLAVADIQARVYLQILILQISHYTFLRCDVFIYYFFKEYFYVYL